LTVQSNLTLDLPNIFQKFLVHSCAAQRDKSNEKIIFNVHPRGSVLERKLDFVHFTLKQGGKIFSGDTVNVESLISL
jgi:hypothetical protein